MDFFNKNEDHNKLLLSVKTQPFKVKLGGGEKRIEKLHAEGKMTARERIDYLLTQKQ
jgi:acetyl-CoA carboxylase carboxyltransferase component